MLPEKKTNTNVGVGLGLLIQVVGVALEAQGAEGAAVILYLVSMVPFIWGCFNYAEGKGYPGRLGLVGLAGLIGLFVLVVLPDQRK